MSTLTLTEITQAREILANQKLADYTLRIANALKANEFQKAKKLERERDLWFKNFWRPMK